MQWNAWKCVVIHARSNDKPLLIFLCVSFNLVFISISILKQSSCQCVGYKTPRIHDIIVIVWHIHHKYNFTVNESQWYFGWQLAKMCVCLDKHLGVTRKWMDCIFRLYFRNTSFKQHPLCLYFSAYAYQFQSNALENRTRPAIANRISRYMIWKNKNCKHAENE